MANKKYAELVPNRIFIGGVDAIVDLLTNENIDVIYDLRAEVKGGLSSDKSIHQPIVDDAEQQDESIQSAVIRVVDAYKDGKNVYFHCNTGRGRAGTIATATLLELGLADSIDEAEQQVKVIHPTIKLKPQFKDALKRIYEK
ncbi:dual specificity protein phosphatase family protein [Sporosarcina sp. E16_8]|uniref:protein-tyrosine phosphatase family protein n=1 Tax=Sporosarcina sp. E16_8 TaxID=2789295 RepID=UPI001A9363D4|nr:dual specificity protein phosphatase family protein [Sporosarcina sp. E16_8]MBO0586273.1 dual specificity protein phosphatase family protein [Sporosarcina sp. E16_8]